MRELSELYGALARGLPSPLARLPIQYADFAVWQRRWLAGEALEAELAWWRERLAGIPAALALPADRPRPAVQSFRGGFRAAAVDPEVAAALAALSRRHGATLFMTVMAAFYALLHRYTGEEDLVVGTPIAGRGRAEVEGLIGFFVNTLVLRASLADDPGFGELLARVRATALEAYAHQDLPFEQLVAELAPQRDLSRAPLFQVMFALQEARRARAAPGPRPRRLAWPGCDRHGQVRPLPRRLARRQRAARRRRVRRRPLRRGDGRPPPGEPAHAAGGHRRGARGAASRASPCSPPASARRCGRPGAAARPCRSAPPRCTGSFERAGAAHAGRAGARLRLPAAHLRRAGRAGAAARPPPARPRRGAGDPGRPLRPPRSPEMIVGAARRSSRPAASTCRSIPSTRRSASPSCWRTPAAPPW